MTYDKTKIKKSCEFVFYFLLAICYLLLIAIPFAHAEDKLTLTITPPFFELNLSPGEFWSSGIKVVNPNAGDLHIYATIMDFEAQGEEGHGRFVPVQNGEDKANSLASWIKLDKQELVVKKGDSAEVPFTLQVPKDASPGGHYGAILIGTNPANANEPGLKISSFISSLFFVRVSGNVNELGDIREFSADKMFYSEPNANFVVRFENSGNVHLHPEGDITIYNMWGKEQGRIFVNNESGFGNVMPRSIRKFNFDWSGEQKLSDFGRYTAILTLAYGEDARHNVSAKVYFWVVPVRELLQILGGLALLLGAIFWGVRRYIKKALREAGLTIRRSGEAGYRGKDVPAASVTAGKNWDATNANGVVDLRSVPARKEMRGGLTAPTGIGDNTRFSKIFLLRKYRLFLAVFVPVAAFILLWLILYGIELIRFGRVIEIKP
jgi:hypothetical protein